MEGSFDKTKGAITPKFYEKREIFVVTYKWMRYFYVSLHSMKEKLLILCLLSLFATTVFAQQPHIIVPDSSLITTDRDSLDIIMEQSKREQELKKTKAPAANDSAKIYPRFTNWRINERTGERYSAVPDTVLYNYQHTTLTDGKSVAMGYLGNLGSPEIGRAHV